MARVVKTPQWIMGSQLPNLDLIYAGRLQRKASRISVDQTHPEHKLFVLLPCGETAQVHKDNNHVAKEQLFPKKFCEIHLSTFCPLCRNNHTHLLHFKDFVCSRNIIIDLKKTTYVS